MNHRIDWNSAVVSDGVLQVAVTPPTEMDWDRIFNHVAQRPIPGVSFSPSDPWGRITVTEGLIEVDHVPQRATNTLHDQLEAAVRETDLEAARAIERERAAEEHRRAAEAQQADRDDQQTQQFRQFGTDQGR